MSKRHLTTPLVAQSAWLCLCCFSTPALAEPATYAASHAELLKKIELAAFKLQTIDEHKNRVEISPEQLTEGYGQRYFFADYTDGSFVFVTPSDGGTTDNTKYARSELRQMTAGANWALTDPRKYTMRARLKVTQVAEPKPGVVIAQIHGSGKYTEMLKLLWRGYAPGKCRVEARFKENVPVPKEFGVVLANDLSLGDMLDVVVSMQAGTVTVSVNGQSASQTYTTEARGEEGKYYFKTGNYLQYNGTPPLESVVKLYALAVAQE